MEPPQRSGVALSGGGHPQRWRGEREDDDDDETLGDDVHKCSCGAAVRRVGPAVRHTRCSSSPRVDSLRLRSRVRKPLRAASAHHDGQGELYLKSNNGGGSHGHPLDHDCSNGSAGFYCQKMSCAGENCYQNKTFLQHNETCMSSNPMCWFLRSTEGTAVNYTSGCVSNNFNATWCTASGTASRCIVECCNSSLCLNFPAPPTSAAATICRDCEFLTSEGRQLQSLGRRADTIPVGISEEGGSLDHGHAESGTLGGPRRSRWSVWPHQLLDV
ncbi:unnamed protein product [Lampetra fluviatilis]